MIEQNDTLELDDIQAGVLRPRPAPYAATYIVLRIDDRKAGRELVRRANTIVASAAHETSPAGDAWVSVSLSLQGFKALGVPQDSLDGFAGEFQQGVAARAKVLGNTGESSPENWESPLGTLNIHVVLTALAPDGQRLESVLERARKAYHELSGTFIAAGDAKDPITGSNDGPGGFTIPRHSICNRLQGLPQFVIVRGGEYCFMPGL